MHLCQLAILARSTPILARSTPGSLATLWHSRNGWSLPKSSGEFSEMWQPLWRISGESPLRDSPEILHRVSGDYPGTPWRISGETLLRFSKESPEIIQRLHGESQESLREETLLRFSTEAVTFRRILQSFWGDFRETVRRLWGDGIDIEKLSLYRLHRVSSASPWGQYGETRTVHLGYVSQGVPFKWSLQFFVPCIHNI